MSRTTYFFTRLSENELELVLYHHRKEFDELINDLFSEGELRGFERLLDAMAAVSVSEMLPDLTFDDFYSSPNQAEQQKAFFESSKSCLCMEEMPFLETNPFQVSYLERLLVKVDQWLIDQGGVEELVFKNEYLEMLLPLKRMESLANRHYEKPTVHSDAPQDIVDFHLVAIYQQLERINGLSLLDQAEEVIGTKSERVQKIWNIVKTQSLTAQQIQKLSGIIPKDFGDSLEQLKFILKKI